MNYWITLVDDFFLFTLYREIPGSNHQKTMLVSLRVFVLKAQPRWQILHLWVALTLEAPHHTVAAPDRFPPAHRLTPCKHWKMFLTPQPPTAPSRATPAHHTWAPPGICPRSRWRRCLPMSLAVVACLSATPLPTDGPRMMDRAHGCRMSQGGLSKSF